MANTRTVTNKLRAAGFPMELVRGNGYFYFTYSSEGVFETESEMVYRFNDLSEVEWVKRGEEFGRKVRRWNVGAMSSAREQG